MSQEMITKQIPKKSHGVFQTKSKKLISFRPCLPGDHKRMPIDLTNESEDEPVHPDKSEDNTEKKRLVFITRPARNKQNMGEKNKLINSIYQKKVKAAMDAKIEAQVALNIFKHHDLELKAFIKEANKFKQKSHIFFFFFIFLLFLDILRICDFK